MKKILLAAAIVGAVAAGVIIYLRDYYSEANELDNVAKDAGDAAGKALHTMNRHIRRAERLTAGLLN